MLIQSERNLSSRRSSIGPTFTRNPSYIHYRKQNSDCSIYSESKEQADSIKQLKQECDERQSRAQSIYSSFAKKLVSNRMDNIKKQNSDSGQVTNFLKQIKSKAIVNRFIQNLFRNSYILPQKLQLQFQDEYISKRSSDWRQTLNQGDNHQFIKIFQPGSQLLMYWDLIGIIINMISLWLSPFQAAFNYQSPIVLIITIILYLFLEILVNLNRSTISFGEIITTRSQIVKHYLQGQGVQDIISLIIWIIIFNKPEFSLIFEVLQIIQIIVTIKKVITNFDKFLESLYSKGQLSNLIDLFSLVITIFFFAHITACVWYYVGEKSDMLLEKSWLQKYEIENESIMMKYNYSIYWATTTIVTVGYGDLTPQNWIEIVFTIIMMFLSSCVYAYSLNSIGIILKNIQDTKYEYKKMLLRINGFMDKNKVEVELQLRARNFIKHHLFQNQNQESQEEINKIMEKLPEDLRNQITKSIQLRILNQITFLKDLFSTQAVTDISRYLETQYLVSNDIVFQQNGSTDSSLYFVQSGQIALFEEQSNKILTTLNRGEKFGEYSFFTGLNPKYSAKCMSDTVLYKIQREKFLQIIQYYQKDFQRFHNIKDQILLNSDYSKCISSCQNCRLFTHEIIDCPLIQYKPNLEQRIKVATFNERQNLRMFHKRSLHKTNCRRLCKTIELSIKAFQDENESKVQISDYQSGYLQRNTFEERDKNTSEEPKSKIVIAEQDYVPPTNFVSANSLQQKRHQTQVRPSIVAQLPKQKMTIIQQEFKSHNYLLNNSFQSQSLNKFQSELFLASFHQTCLQLDQMRNYKDYMPQNNISAIIIQMDKAPKKQSKRRKREIEDLNKYTFFYYVKTMAIKLRKFQRKSV
ncbi:unnamed protein product (macronuclear) [Paramecium tetraurelia]|uniref:Cyclic nucleotide-binding domain-containing protein n=1 Tax=Paramecium tetraurelia TaxID=5888 RepID=A0EHX6_PARTE|nr:uncharacterized protein GSPATT00027244001 [Paramecium tetraurelia]CAK94917.1 unnamed protein product [Paramecium tetraurelia]|eukprot:XP_001462290.1 hypothetical protein (macronuclear) [Paramecium tetraurelia strain d4-2]